MCENRTSGLIGPRLPEGMLLYAVGDIHGQNHLLDVMLERITRDAKGREAERRMLVFVGDYVDRGPDSAGVVERLVSGLPQGFEACFLMGNHEAILLAFLDDPQCWDQWRMNGAEATLASYGVTAPEPGASPSELARCRDRFAAALPPAHRTFFGNLDLSAAFGDYLFVHAGVRPGVPLDQQSSHDLLWIRHAFLDSEEDLGAVVVHGHTPGPEPVVRANRIGIDTGAWAYGRLTAVRLSGGTRSFLSVEQHA